MIVVDKIKWLGTRVDNLGLSDSIKLDDPFGLLKYIL